MANNKTKILTSVSIFIALEIMMTFVPYLGFIPLPFLGINATTLHIPVIICAIVLGLKPGLIMGTTFGILSVIVNTFRPNVTSFVFSPFYDGGNFYSLIIAIVPRILIAVSAYFVFKLLLKIFKNESLAICISAICGSLTSTFLVMGGIYVFFGQAYALAKDTPYSELLPFIIGVISFNGVVEAIVAGIICLAVCKVLLKFYKKI